MTAAKSVLIWQALIVYKISMGTLVTRTDHMQLFFVPYVNIWYKKWPIVTYGTINFTICLNMVKLIVPYVNIWYTFQKWPAYGKMYTICLTICTHMVHFLTIFAYGNIMFTICYILWFVTTYGHITYVYLTICFHMVILLMYTLPYVNVWSYFETYEWLYDTYDHIIYLYLIFKL